MPLPKVAIVGRPNVGKSSLFNWLAGRRIAIVEPTAGVTRDRLATLVKLDDRFFVLIDTGGMGIQDVDNLTDEVERQIAIAIDEANLIVFLVDVRDGVVPLDEEVARRLRQVAKPVILVINKCDTPELERFASEFHRLGQEAMVRVSAQQKRNKEELLQLIEERLPESREGGAEGEPERTDLKLAIVGRRNTGKSTFINSLAQAERVIVSEVPGTTRDSVDVHFERDGKRFIAIDTAGIRKKSKIANSIEFYSLARAERSIRRADVVLLFLDAVEPTGQVDKHLADYIVQNHKPAIFVVNKWDLAKPTGVPTGTWAEYLRKTFPSLDYVPIAFITAKSGKNVQTLLNLAQNLYKQAGARVGTADLNRVVEEAIARQSPPVRGNKQPRIYFATQADVHPPTIVLFTNGPSLFDPPYVRYLLTTFRDRLPFREVPIKLHLRHRGREDAPKEPKTAKDAPAKPARKKPRLKPAAKTPARKKPARGPEVWDV